MTKLPESMARLGIAFIILLTIVSHVIALSDRKIIAGKYMIMANESSAAANALRKVIVDTPHHKIQLATIANDFAVSLNRGAFSLGNIIANIADPNVYDAVAHGIDLLGNTTNGIQQALSNDPEQLKEKLVVLLEAISQAAHKKTDRFKDVTNQFITSQVKKDLDYVIYGISKLRYQATYFDKTNKELIPEMHATLSQLTETLNSMPPDRQGSEAKLRDVLLLATIVTTRNVYKIGNWIELNDVNKKPNKNIKSAEEILEDIGSLYLTEMKAIIQDRNELKIKKNFINIYTTGVKLGTQLANLEYSDNTGGIELIRSTLFDVVTLGRVISENVPRLLQTL